MRTRNVLPKGQKDVEKTKTNLTPFEKLVA
jgi:hypothetical protein